MSQVIATYRDAIKLQNEQASRSVSDGFSLSDSALTVLFEDSFLTGERAPNNGNFGWGAARAGADEQGTDDIGVYNKIARTGSYSLEFKFGGDVDGKAWAEQKFVFTDPQTEVWFEFYLYVPDGTEGWSAEFLHRDCVQDGNKFFALWDENYSGSDAKVLLSYRHYDGLPNSSYLYPISMLPQGWTRSYYDFNVYTFLANRKGEWTRFRIYVKADTAAAEGDGRFKVWIADTLEIDFTGTNTKTGASNLYFRNGYLLGWANSGFDDDTRLMIDDFKTWISDPGW